MSNLSILPTPHRTIFQRPYLHDISCFSFIIYWKALSCFNLPLKLKIFTMENVTGIFLRKEVSELRKKGESWGLTKEEVDEAILRALGGRLSLAIRASCFLAKAQTKSFRSAIICFLSPSRRVSFSLLIFFTLLLVFGRNGIVEINVLCCLRRKLCLHIASHFFSDVKLHFIFPFLSKKDENRAKVKFFRKSTSWGSGGRGSKEANCACCFATDAQNIPTGYQLWPFKLLFL